MLTVRHAVSTLLIPSIRLAGIYSHSLQKCLLVPVSASSRRLKLSRERWIHSNYCNKGNYNRAHSVRKLSMPWKATHNAVMERAKNAAIIAALQSSKHDITVLCVMQQLTCP